MTDHFARLGLSPRAALDPEELKARYHELARESHGEEGADSADLNAAFSCLPQPSTRLRHLLELLFPDEASQRLGGTIPGVFIDLFSSLATAIQKVDAVGARKKAARSALAQALVAGDEMEAREAIEAVGSLIHAERHALEETFPELDTSMAFDKLSRAYRAFGFLDKWQAQVRAKLLELYESDG